MDIRKLRGLLVREKIALRFTAHALTEGRKDGLTAEDMEDTIVRGNLIEDYGTRALLLHSTTDDKLPCHVVLEYSPAFREAVVVTAYIPDATEWEPNWKKRKRKRSP
jgi:hypothetical protein